MVWKVSIGGQVYDADFETLKQWVAQGSVGPTDQVYKEGMGWSEARNVPVLRDFFAPPSPPAPYGQPQPGYDPSYGQSPPSNPYAQPPNPYAQASNPYAPPSNPYGQPPGSYGAPPDPYAPVYGMPPMPSPGYGGMFDNGDVATLKSDAQKAMIFGIISLFCCGVILGGFSIYYGVNSRKGLQSYGVEEGQGMALAGIILGTFGVVLHLFWFVIQILARMH
jgi:Domain of unknown function (DUF4190)